ncbi:hypothetical protein [Stakelama saccharophila]|uniref:Lipoprotein n=1 Tax=Stakelama saccharophila TaxID=3075605 RepID=A0ABZ0BB74_9SPHN|nr:hypothetical protein [Stakelama sp. W311]WNO54528.1 hypothetical protein RPR59_04535 [Stakelama sp. W311]
MKALWAIAAAGTAVSACTAIPSAETARIEPPSVNYSTVGLERVVGQHAEALERLFGRPDADTTEGVARKLQFMSDICVLDAYLYPPKGGGRPVVTYVDARERDGSPIDRASCVAALTRRDGGK